MYRSKADGNKEEKQMSDFNYKDFSYKDWSYKDYEESERVKQYLNDLNKHNASKPGEYQSKYQAVADEVLNNYMNRDKFSYDLNGDALYQQYKDKYITQGKMAMQDTIAQASAMTGGYGNSYAANVGNQAYQASLQNLNNIVPELYQMAYNQYQQEGQDMLNKYGIYMDRENQEYGRYRDSISDWNAERDYLTNLYNAERTYDYSKYSDNRNFDYGVYSDSRNFAYNQYESDRTLAYNEHRNAIADEQWQKTFDQALAEFNYQKEQDAIANEQWQKNYNLQSDLSSYQKEISSLKSQISGMIDPDKLEVDPQTGAWLKYDGKNITGNSNNSSNYVPSISGFRTAKGDNFTVSLDGKNYTVENKGKVDDKATIKKLANATSYGDIKILDGNAYYVKGNSYYKLGAVALWGKKDYGNLLSKLQG